MSQVTINQMMLAAVEHQRAGRLAQAEAIYKQVLSVAPNHAEAWHLLGVTASQANRPDIAVQCLDRSLALSPNFPQAHNNLGSAYLAMGQLDLAIASFRKAIELKPDYTLAHNHLGIALHEKGQLPEAADCFRRAIELKRDFALAHNNLGIVLHKQGELEAAIGSLERAIAIDPDYAQSYNNLGKVLSDVGQFEESIVRFQQAVAMTARDGTQVSAAATFQLGLHAGSGEAALHSNLIFSLHYGTAHGAEEIFQAHREWNERHARRFSDSISPHKNDRSAGRRLRIGFVSPDMRAHSVAYFLVPLLESHDHANFEMTCYAANTGGDWVTERMKKSADRWREIAILDDDRAAELVREDQIDVLIDLAGHTAGNRLLLFARKPAPIQATYLGYPNTTGMDAIDYRFTDAKADPVGETDRWCSEKLLRLPETAWCFTPLSGTPEIAAPPFLENGYVTFGSFNNSAKLSSSLLEMWAALLKEVPSSHLLIKNQAMGALIVRRKLLAFFAERGIASTRIELVSPAPSPEEHLRCYGRIDIALDSFPYHGTTTTCEAAWMSVPTVTLAGATHVSRVGVSLLTTLGLSDLIAANEEQYIQVAKRLASDAELLGSLHRSLRGTMANSPLMNPKRFTHEFEKKLREIWKLWI